MKTKSQITAKILFEMLKSNKQLVKEINDIFPEDDMGVEYNYDLFIDLITNSKYPECSLLMILFNEQIFESDVFVHLLKMFLKDFYKR